MLKIVIDKKKLLTLWEQKMNNEAYGTLFQWVKKSLIKRGEFNLSFQDVWREIGEIPFEEFELKGDFSLKSIKHLLKKEGICHEGKIYTSSDDKLKLVDDEIHITLLAKIHDLGIGDTILRA